MSTMGESSLREQFFCDMVNVPSVEDAEEYANEACLLEGDQLVASFTRRDDDRWDLDATEIGVGIWDAAAGKTWATAREALDFAHEWLANEG